jgi:hypothetical protein
MTQLLKDEMKWNDVTIISKETGYSTVTVQKALKGEIKTRASEIVVKYAKILIKQREERLKKLKEIEDATI